MTRENGFVERFNASPRDDRREREIFCASREAEPAIGG